MADIAIVLGNGRSRLGLDLNLLKNFGKVYGCNALYRDFTPDVLVSTDAGISEEIQTSGYSRTNVHYTRNPINGSGSIPIDRLLYGFSSGPVALGIASREHSYIYFAGYDLSGIGGKVNNVYSGTNHYKAPEVEATYFGNWVRQIAEVMRRHPTNRFIRIVTEGHYTPIDWSSHACYRELHLKDFEIMLNKNKAEKT